MRELKHDAYHRVRFILNGRSVTAAAEPRLLLSDFLRHTLGATGTHVGCEHGVCGACTVRVDGQAVRSCLMLAVQADGCTIETVEGLADNPSKLTPLQEAFRTHHALQCGYCTAGILMSFSDLFARNACPDETAIRDVLSGHLCRCTGYAPIVDAAMACAADNKVNDNV